MFVIQSTIPLRTVETALLSIRSQGSLHRAKKISEKSLAMRLGTTAEQSSFQSPSAVSQVCHRLSGRSRSVLGRTYNSKPLPFSDIGATSTGETGHLCSHPLGLNTHQQADGRPSHPGTRQAPPAALLSLRVSLKCQGAQLCASLACIIRGATLRATRTQC